MRQGPLVGVVARLQPEKGVSIFLEAAARVGVAFPTCRFLIVGDGPLREELAIQAERLGLSQRVHFLGFRGDARALIELLDVLVVSSLSEGAPLVVLEGMSAGVPVIASAVGGIPEQIRPAVEGLLVPPGDARSLAEACIRLLQHPDWGRRMGEAGRQRAASQFSHAAMVERIEDVYQMLLRQQVSSVALHGTVPELFRTKLVR
jgi:glycosyltransferase involved in cell wall biosynthesis